MTRSSRHRRVRQRLASNDEDALGFAEAGIPAETRDSGEQIMTVHAGMLVHSVTTVEQALAALGLQPGDQLQPGDLG